MVKSINVRSFACAAVSLAYVCCGSDVYAAGMVGSDRLFFSLGYGPTISDVSSFGIRIDEKAKMIIPYEKRNFQIQLHSTNFDFANGSLSPDTEFERRTQGLKGSVGYTVAGMRLEFEIERERTRIALSNKENRLRDGGVPFLLVDDVLEYVLGDSCDTEEFIDKTSLFKLYYSEIQALVRESGKMQEQDGMVNAFKNIATTGITAEGIKDEVLKVKRIQDISNSYKKLVGAHRYIVGRDISAMEKKDRAYFARVLAIREKSADVVEVGDIRSTTLTANLCYDFPWMEVGSYKKLSPYACAGIGSSAVGLTSDYWKAKVSGKVKVGVNFSLTPNLQAYAGGMYLKVFGDDYTGLPTERMADDYTPRVLEGDDEEQMDDKATVSFRLKHYGLEFGARMFF